MTLRHAPARAATGEYMSCNCRRVRCRRSATTPSSRYMKAKPKAGSLRHSSSRRGPLRAIAVQRLERPRLEVLAVGHEHRGPAELVAGLDGVCTRSVLPGLLDLQGDQARVDHRYPSLHSSPSWKISWSRWNVTAVAMAARRLNGPAPGPSARTDACAASPAGWGRSSRARLVSVGGSYICDLTSSRQVARLAARWRAASRYAISATAAAMCAETSRMPASAADTGCPARGRPRHQLRERARRRHEHLVGDARGARGDHAQARRPGRCTSCCPGAARSVLPPRSPGRTGCRRRRARGPRLHLYACSAVHSDFDVGFESAKMIGRSLIAPSRARTSSVNAPPAAATPMMAVGLSARHGVQQIGDRRMLVRVGQLCSAGPRGLPRRGPWSRPASSAGAPRPRPGLGDHRRHHELGDAGGRFARALEQDRLLAERCRRSRAAPRGARPARPRRCPGCRR